MEEKELHHENAKETGNSIIKDAIHRWLGLFLVIVAAILVYFLVTNANQVIDGVLGFLGMIKPVIYGCVIAYILNPLMKWIQNKLLWLLERKGKKVSEKRKSFITGISIFVSLVFMILIIVVLCWMIIPQLVESVTSLINNLPDKANHYYEMINSSIRNNEYLADKLQDVALNATDYMEEMITTKVLPWMQSDLLPSVSMVAEEFANGLMGFLTVLYNLFIGIIVAIYLLASKESFSAQAKKAIYALCRKDVADVVLHYIKITDHMFSGFIIGKIVDSTIIGFICFVVMQIFQLPYAMLISVIIGVTNIIPVFGPYLGLIPSVFLILLVSPIQALYFIIIIAILQQVDGNIIGPAILGESTGLSAFWVLFSILLFGGLWGIVGMIVGVPLFAVIYRIAADFINWKLTRKSLSTVTDHYYNLKSIQIQGDKVIYVPYTPEDLVKKSKEKDKPTFTDKFLLFIKNRVSGNGKRQKESGKKEK